MPTEVIVALAGMGCATVIEVVALLKGRNGQMQRLTLIAIALIAGVPIKELLGG